VAKLPLNLSKAIEAWKEASARADQSASILLAGDEGLVRLAQERFSAGGTVPATWVGPLRELSEVSSVPGEVLVVLVRQDQEAEVLDSLTHTRRRGGAVVAVAEGPETAGRVVFPGKGLARVSFADSGAGWARICDACIEVAADRVIALGRRYPSLRAAATRRVINRTAGQNALVGLVFFIPGADMPVMTLNQMKMVLDIASIYGERVDVDRAVELAGIVGLGFGFRAAARRMMQWIPGIGLVIKPVMAYTATLGVGRCAVQYFEKGAPVSTGQVVALARSFKN